MLKKYMQKLKKDQRGLTLVELLAVVVILAIVAAIAFIVIGNVIENSKRDAHVSNAQQAIAAAKLYETSGGKIETSITTKQLSDGAPETGVGNDDAIKGEGLLGTLINPWSKEKYTSVGTITKDGNAYIINWDAEEADECKFVNAKEEDLAKGRGTACKKTR